MVAGDQAWTDSIHGPSRLRVYVGASCLASRPPPKSLFLGPVVWLWSWELQLEKKLRKSAPLPEIPFFCVLPLPVTILMTAQTYFPLSFPGTELAASYFLLQDVNKKKPQL